MKRAALLTLVLCTVVLLAGEGGTLPSKEGQTPRYQVVSGQIKYDPSGDLQPTFIRLDTWTGATWALNPHLMRLVGNAQTGNKDVISHVHAWQLIPEEDSTVVEAARQSLNAR